MQDIDFLPRQYHEEHAQRKNQFWRLVVVALFAAMVASAAFSQYRRRMLVGAQLAATTTEHTAVQSQAAQLAGLQAELREIASQAELWTYLGHPWPRTQIIAAVIEPLDERVVLNDLHLYRLQPAPTYGAPVRDRSRAASPATGEEEADKRTAAQRDLADLQQLCDEASMVVSIKGATLDNAALHRYLAALERSPLFSKVELLTVESSQTASAAARFSARLTVRPGYGQQDGPTAPQTALTLKP